MAGDKDLTWTRALVRAAVAGGADMIELGIPYSDPIADGPAIQAAAQRALASHTTFDRVLETARAIAAEAPGVPMYAFSYYNLVFARGIDRTAADLKHAGFAGAVIPDLPPEEGAALATAFSERGLSTIFLIAPNTPLERAKRIAELCGDFVYVVSRPGVTGATHMLADRVRDLVDRLRPLTAKPLAVGFGVATPADARTVAETADAVIVGSALVERVAEAATLEAAVDSVRDFCHELGVAMTLTGRESQSRR